MPITDAAGSPYSAQAQSSTQRNPVGKAIFSANYNVYTVKSTSQVAYAVSLFRTSPILRLIFQ